MGLYMRGAPSIYRPTLSIHFFSNLNTIGVDTWHSFADTWLGVHIMYTWRAVHTWPVTPH